MGLARSGLVLALAASALADSWMPYGERLSVSRGRKHFLVTRALRGAGPPMHFELYRIRPGVAPPRSPAGAAARGKLVAKGTHTQLPVEVKVLDGEAAAVLFENYGDVGLRDSVALLDGQGKIRWRVKLEDLFGPAQIREFVQTSGSVWWYRSWWVDERKGKVVVVSKTNLMRRIDLKTGAVLHAKNEVLLARMRKGALEERQGAIETAGGLKVEGAAALLATIAADTDEPVSIRLRAVVALRRVPDTSFFVSVLNKPRLDEDQKYALSNMGDALGKEAIPLARKLARKKEQGYFVPQGLVALGDQGVPLLLEILLDSEIDIQVRYQAAFALEKIKTHKAADALARGVAEAPPGVAYYACIGLLRGEPPGLVDHLCALLRRGTSQDGQIAFWLIDRPDPKTIGPLLQALGRAKKPIDVLRCRKALQAVTGKDFGDDAGAWRKGLGLR